MHFRSIALDTNILVYAHRRDSPWFQAAYACVEGLADGRNPWAIPWPCVHEFIAIVTNPRGYKPATPLEQALDQLKAWFESPNSVAIAETETYWSVLETLLRSSRVTGGKVHDARIAALCLHHGVDELWTADRDFSRFPGLKVRNPLIS